MNTLQMINRVYKFDWYSFIEWTMSLNGILQVWPFLSKIICGLKRSEPIPKESREGEENTSDFVDNDSNPSEGSAHGSHKTGEELHNSDDIKA